MQGMHILGGIFGCNIKNARGRRERENTTLKFLKYTSVMRHSRIYYQCVYSIVIYYLQ